MYCTGSIRYRESFICFTERKSSNWLFKTHNSLVFIGWVMIALRVISALEITIKELKGFKKLFAKQSFSIFQWTSTLHSHESTIINKKRYIQYQAKNYFIHADRSIEMYEFSVTTGRKVALDTIPHIGRRYSRFLFTGYVTRFRNIWKSEIYYKC